MSTALRVGRVEPEGALPLTIAPLEITALRDHGP